MGDRAEVSHQPRTSDDHSLRLGCWADGGYTLRQTASIGLGPVRLLRRPRTSGVGPACSCRWPARGGLGRPACRSPEVRRAGRPCARALTHGRGLRRGRVHSARSGTCRRGRGRSTPSGTGIRSPYARAVPGWSGPHSAAWDVPGSDGDASASGCRGSARSAPVLRRPPAWNCRESDWKTWDACGTHPHKRPMSDKPDLSLVHLRGCPRLWVPLRKSLHFLQ